MESGIKALKSVPIKDEYLMALKIRAEAELKSDSEKPTGSMVTRKLEPETATSDILTRPKTITDASLCQRLPSKSPYIQLGIVTTADYVQFKAQKLANKEVRTPAPVKPSPSHANVPIMA